MVSVIKGQSKLETLYRIMLLVENKGSGLLVTTTDVAADGIQAGRHRRHGVRDEKWEEVLAGEAEYR